MVSAHPVEKCFECGLEFSAEFFVTVGYTGVYNILDYSCVSFPSGISVDKSTDVGLGDSHVPLGDVCKIIHEECKPVLSQQ